VESILYQKMRPSVEHPNTHRLHTMAKNELQAHTAYWKHLSILYCLVVCKVQNEL